MKAHIFLLFFALLSCGRGASPEGRSIIRDEQLVNQIDSLKFQNQVLADRIVAMDKRLEALERK